MREFKDYKAVEEKFFLAGTGGGALGWEGPGLKGLRLGVSGLGYPRLGGPGLGGPRAGGACAQVPWF